MLFEIESVRESRDLTMRLQSVDSFPHPCPRTTVTKRMRGTLTSNEVQLQKAKKECAICRLDNRLSLVELIYDFESNNFYSTRLQGMMTAAL